MEIFEENEIASLKDTIRTIAEDGHELICQTVECYPDKCKEKGCALKSALFYLKELDKHRTPILTGKKFHVTLDIVCPQCGSLANSKTSFCPSCGKEIFGKGQPFEECDCPLTWNELRKMEGKPVWIEGLHHKHWCIIKCFYKNVLSGAEYITLAYLDDHNRIVTYDRRKGNFDIDWQAFRKEMQHE